MKLIHYNALIKPYMEYGIELWGSAKIKQLKKLNKLNKMAAGEDEEDGADEADEEDDAVDDEHDEAGEKDEEDEADDEHGQGRGRRAELARVQIEHEVEHALDGLDGRPRGARVAAGSTRPPSDRQCRVIQSCSNTGAISTWTQYQTAAPTRVHAPQRTVARLSPKKSVESRLIDPLKKNVLFSIVTLF